jgi:hypothetical protein
MDEYHGTGSETSIRSRGRFIGFTLKCAMLGDNSLYKI